MDVTDAASIERIAQSLTTAWNDGDGAAFVRSFTDEADFVNIYAMHAVGRDAIMQQHQAIFDGVYRDSRVRFTVATSRPLADGVVLAHIKAELHVPHGPMTGDVRTLATVVLVRDDAGWRIASFHNTREQSPASVPSAGAAHT